MQFVIKTTYDQKAMTVMARTLRKTLRRRRSRIAHIFGWIVAALGLMLVYTAWKSETGMDASDYVTFLAVLVIIVVSFTEDAINGWFAARKMLPGTRETASVFSGEGYVTKSGTIETRWGHDKIQHAFETKDYFVFFLSSRHGQVYDKHGFEEGTPEEFRNYLAKMTGKPVKYVK